MSEPPTTSRRCSKVRPEVLPDFPLTRVATCTSLMPETGACYESIVAAKSMLFFAAIRPIFPTGLQQRLRAMFTLWKLGSLFPANGVGQGSAGLAQTARTQ